MSVPLLNFFKKISEDKFLQEALYSTKNMDDVANLAQARGFNVRPAEVLRAQAERLIELATSAPDEAKLATAGKKPNIGAQWGREGNGFLEQSGYWFIQLHQWGCVIQSFNPNFSKLFSQINQDDELKFKIISACKTIDDLSAMAKSKGYDISPGQLLVYQALCILSLSEEHANLLACGLMV